jgi:hypothetical protein
MRFCNTESSIKFGVHIHTKTINKKLTTQAFKVYNVSRKFFLPVFGVPPIS